MVTGYEFRTISPFNDAGFAEVLHAQSGERGVISQAGTVVTGQYYKQVERLGVGMAGFDGTSWRVFDYEGQEIPIAIEGQIRKVGYFKDNDLFVQDDKGKWSHIIVLADGSTEVKPTGFQVLRSLRDGYAYARKDKRSLLYGRDNQVTPPAGQHFKFWSEQLIGIRTNSSEYFANLGMQNVFDRHFDLVNPFVNGTAVVNYRGKFGVINRNGMFVIPPKFDKITPGKGGLFQSRTIRSATGTVRCGRNGDCAGEVQFHSLYRKRYHSSGIRRFDRVLPVEWGGVVVAPVIEREDRSQRPSSVGSVGRSSLTGLIQNEKS